MHGPAMGRMCSVEPLEEQLASVLMRICEPCHGEQFTKIFVPTFVFHQQKCAKRRGAVCFVANKDICAENGLNTPSPGGSIKLNEAEGVP
ncbi:MAG: hypothetical protein EBS90_10300 [Betaproteobacteria bacterium]|nr:hypothetical protein [Betaproteobacteria bacterium]